MQITQASTVGDIAAAFPQTMPFFESNYIDYCCGGQSTLESVCELRHLAVDEFVKDLEKTIDSSPAQPITWTGASLSTLISHIINVHHVRCRTESERLMSLLNKVVAKHSAEHTELPKIRRLFAVLSDDLKAHMLDEERTLFPHIEQLEQSKLGTPTWQSGTFVSVAGSVREMVENHDEAGALLGEIRDASSDYRVPADACSSYRALLEGLSQFEHDLRSHVHLENNILFPRACNLEESGRIPAELTRGSTPVT
ncbi:MAG TPA: iron-sulfur cluster repair di-iron protein [Bryobacteraceae bacterium]